jgi:hypothetical protein
MCHTDNNNIVWFLPSGRRYPTEELRPTISSTSICTTLDEADKHKAYDKIKSMAMNPQELLGFLGIPQHHIKLAKVAKFCRRKN